jgi:hypothetical protein
LAITEDKFVNEKELDTWIAQNITSFLPGSIYISGFQVSTVSGKSGVPDGFAFNLEEQEWFVIEAELLTHGVWPHIAEQIVRFIVAMQNPQTRRKVRDRLFEDIVSRNVVDEASTVLETTRERLLQQLELFIEGVDPQVVIFIDDTNKDLYDMAQALSADIKIFRVKKFLVDGKPEYLSPDQSSPIISTEPDVEQGVRIKDFEIVNLLGGGQLENSTGKRKIYQIQDGSMILVKRSKYHPRHDYYWYGITPTVVDYCRQHDVTHIVFVMGDEGLVRVPAETVWQFLQQTRTSQNPDGSIRHYHCLISPGPEPELYYSQEISRFDLKDYYQAF